MIDWVKRGAPVKLRDGREVEDRRLDRLPQYDDASRKWQVRKRLGAVRSVKPKAWRPSRPGLDQQNFGACVLASGATMLNASPVRHKPPVTFEQAKQWYFDVQRTDEFAGGEYPGASPVSGGTSLLAGMRYLHGLGLIGSYWWCGAGSGTATDDYVDAHALGNVQLGVRWLGSMFTPEPGGRLRVEPDSGEYGYHAIASIAFRYAKVPGYGTKKIEHGVLQQTWGPEWGVEWFGVPGHCFLFVEDLEAHLLPQEYYGEAVVPVGA